MNHQPRKRFGQNFLQDEAIIQRIIDVIEPDLNLPIVEIGPGQGALTIPLLAQLPNLTVIELDRDLIDPLASRAKSDKLTILQQDAIQFDFNQLEQTTLHVVGNLPYNISTPLLFHLFEFDCIQRMTFMLQKEVVDRLCAETGDSDYSRLSVMAQFYCEMQKEFDVPPEAFYPAPKVTSSIISIQRKASEYADIDRSLFSKLIQQAFSQRRKMIRNNLKMYFSSKQLEAHGIDPQARPQDIGLAAFIDLCFALQTNLPTNNCG